MLEFPNLTELIFADSGIRSFLPSTWVVLTVNFRVVTG